MEALPPATRRGLILSVGTHQARRPLTPVEVGEALELLIASGATSKDVAESLHLEDPTMIARFRRLLQLAPEVRHLVDWGKSPSSISLTVASEVARLSGADAQQAVVEAALRHGLSASEVRQVVQILQRSDKVPSEAIESVLRLRPEVVRRHVLVGAVLDEKVRRRIGNLSQKERDALLREALEQRHESLPSWTGHLGVERFTLVGGDDFAAVVRRWADDYETEVNKCLVEAVAVS